MILDATEDRREDKEKKPRNVKQICRSLDTAKKELLGNRGISGSGEKGKRVKRIKRVNKEKAVRRKEKS
jgi:hypothetical protein